MQAAGLQPRIDPAGNIFARRPGTDSLQPILFGSHIDSVPSGGNFDGDLGSLSALAVLEALEGARIRTRHPLEMVVWAHEEGFAFGRGLACSRIVAGDFKPTDLDEVWNGLRRADAIHKIGGDPDRMAEARRPKGSHHCYLELHIEQGGTLDRTGVPVGVVEGIVAIDRFDANITGVANHAGTTPIVERHDALLAAAHLTVAVRDAVIRVPGRQVGTVGRIEATPNSPNVIPGFARISIELRDLSPVTLVTMMDDIRARAREIAASTQTTIKFTQTMQAAPAVADLASAERRRSRCTDDGPAWANGHDLRAQRGRHQPRAPGTDPLGRLRAGRRRLAGHRPGDGSRRLRNFGICPSVRSSVGTV
jgi:N-carbamoyl-L-amino-acid hydrolase